jgi:hypothetical protein
MKNYDLYGFASEDLEGIRRALEDALGFRFSPHESSYKGGDYYLREDGEERLTLQRNLDLDDGEPAEQSYPDVKTLLYVEGTERPEFFAGVVAELAGGTLLRSERL